MNEMTYEDYKQRVNIQEVLQDAGYRFYRRDGLRYPSYVRVGDDGHRVHGDKYIVTANGLCCFQPPERRNYNVISFIKEHAELFRDYTPGMNKDRLVNLVCRRLLNLPEEVRTQQVVQPPPKDRPFDLGRYAVQRFTRNDWDGIQALDPYMHPRGIDLRTVNDFADHLLLTTKTYGKGKHTHTNLSFPLTIPGKDDTVVGLEERSKPNEKGKTAYKGKAQGSNAREGLWIANLSTGTLNEAQDVLWFESGYDALAYYQLHRHTLRGAHAVYVSTGGNPGDGQLKGLLTAAPQALHHACFDRDKAGEAFAKQLETARDQLRLDTKIRREPSLVPFKDWNEQLMAPPGARLFAHR